MMAAYLVFLLVALSTAVTYVGSRGQYSYIAVARGANITLYCDAVDDSAVYDVTWFKDSDPVEGLNDTRLVTTTSHTHELTIHFSGSHHKGNYSCLVQASADGVNKYHTCPVRVEHASISARGFIREPEPTAAMVGDMIVLRCTPPRSIPPAIVMWKKEGLYLHASVDSRLTIMPSGNLYITNVTAEDEGGYQCIAINPVTEAKRRSNETMLTVTDVTANSTQPAFLVVPQNTSAKVGDRVVIECAVSGNPPPIVEWYKVNARHFPHTGEVLPTGALVFDSITAEDTGLYHCGVIDESSNVQATIFIDVKELPTFTVPLPDSVTMTTGTNITLTCEVTGSAPLHLLFYQNGQLLQDVSDTENNGVQITHTVVNVDQSHSGIYQCLAMNDIGCVQSQTVVMVTEVLPTVSATGSGDSGEILVPSLVLTPTQLVLNHGQMRILTCEASPGVTIIRWRLTHEENVEYLSSSYDDGSKLIVDQPGVYICMGIDSTPSIILSNEAIVTVLSPPPLDVMVTNDKVEVINGQSVEIKCKARGGNGQLQVDWMLKDEVLPSIMQTSDDGGIIKILKLDPAYEGEFVCVATTSSGESLSSTVCVMLVVSPPMSEPASVTVTFIPGFLRISWLPPEDNNNELLLGYKIAYDMTWRVHKSARHSLPSSARNFTIPLFELSPLSAHTVLLWAYTLGGDGPETVLNFNNLTTPTPLIMTTMMTHYVLECQLIGNKVAVLNWEGSHVNISYGCDEIASGNLLTVSLTTTPYSITGLLPNCTYIFEVQRSSETDITPCSVQTLPAEVDIDVEVERYSNGSVQLLWHHLKELNPGNSEVFINWGKGWKVVEPGLHFPAHFDTQQEYTVQLRFRAGQWEGIKTVNIPRAPSTTSPPEIIKTVNIPRAPSTTSPPEIIKTVNIPRAPSTTSPPEIETESNSGSEAEKIGLIYGMIFGGLIVACSLVVIVILVLKYIQMTRRDKDKGSNKRELEREQFRRMSLERSSTMSTKKTPSIASTSTSV